MPVGEVIPEVIHRPADQHMQLVEAPGGTCVPQDLPEPPLNDPSDGGRLLIQRPHTIPLDSPHAITLSGRRGRYTRRDRDRRVRCRSGRGLAGGAGDHSTWPGDGGRLFQVVRPGGRRFALLSHKNTGRFGEFAALQQPGGQVGADLVDAAGVA
ncbi:hypothetical protein ACFQ07_30550, partial [Actinomadura adrarensis]